MAGGQHIAIRRDDDQAGQEVVLCALTLTRQIWLICARRDVNLELSRGII
jgi:hypothetical protein